MQSFDIHIRTYSKDILSKAIPYKKHIPRLSQDMKNLICAVLKVQEDFYKRVKG